MTGRFAPSTTGLAHPGTLLAALLAWLDARSRGGRFVLRLDDADPQRCRPQWSQRMREDLRWFGLDWDEEQSQQQRRPAHESAIDSLAALGLVYACSCSRREIRGHGQRAIDGGWRYPGSCRERSVLPDAWRHGGLPLRLRLPDQGIGLRDASGLDLSGHPLRELGDPVIRRRDGAIAYQLSVVLDDADAGIAQVVRGRDLAVHSAIQAQIHDLLGLPRPVYRHHLLLLESRHRKLAKFHQAVDLDALRPHYQAPALCGILAACAGLGDGEPCLPAELLRGFDWSRVATCDRQLSWDGARLAIGPAINAAETAGDD